MAAEKLDLGKRKPRAVYPRLFARKRRWKW